VCLFIYYACLFLCLLLVCWVRENFSGGPGHIFPVWDSAVWSAGPVQFIFGHFLGADGGTVQIFLFLWLCCSGYGTVEMVRGVVRLFLLPLVSVSSLGGCMSVVGFLCYII
jgi:hypothetical protein